MVPSVASKTTVSFELLSLLADEQNSGVTGTIIFFQVSYAVKVRNMWYYLFFQFIQDPPEFIKYTQYITVRGALACFTAFFFGSLSGPFFISMLKKLQFLENTEKCDSKDLVEQQKAKKNTPTMGGLLIFFAFLFAILLWARLDNRYVLWTILAAVGFGLVGFLDDLIKASTHEKGLSSRGKTALMLIVSIALAIVLWRTVRHNPTLVHLYFPFLRDVKINLAFGGGFLFMLFATVVIIGSSNAVNLTDGLDGLAIGCTIIVSTAFTVIAYIVGRQDFSGYLSIAFIPGAGELAICCAALVGAGLAFLWFNCFPATVFMGDCGALMLGGFLGYVAVALRQELLLFIVGGIFVIEAFSVILQVTYFKISGGKRIFLCSPIHYHFRLKGWNETKVTIRFLIIEVLLALFAIATLKLR